MKDSYFHISAGAPEQLPQAQRQTGSWSLFIQWNVVVTLSNPVLVHSTRETLDFTFTAEMKLMFPVEILSTTHLSLLRSDVP